jgi:hypothetical protein
VLNVIHNTNEKLDLSYDVVTTVRSHEKGQRILDAHSQIGNQRLSYVVVEDIAKEEAFNEVQLTTSLTC